MHDILKFAGGHFILSGVVVSQSGLIGLLKRRRLATRGSIRGGHRPRSGTRCRSGRTATHLSTGLAAGRGILDVLQLCLQVLDRLIQLGDTRLHFVDRVVQGLHLAGDGVQFAAAGFGLRI